MHCALTTNFLLFSLDSELLTPHVPHAKETRMYGSHCSDVFVSQEEEEEREGVWVAVEVDKNVQRMVVTSNIHLARKLADRNHSPVVAACQQHVCRTVPSK